MTLTRESGRASRRPVHRRRCSRWSARSREFLVCLLLLARQGVAVTLLEMHNDFDRDFRGDTIHPSVPLDS